MHIIRSNKSHIAQLVVLFEEYRAFWGIESSVQEVEAFLTKLISNEESVIFIAVDDNTKSIMGFVNLYPCYSTLALQRLWILNDLSVSEDYRGKGVSKKLIQKVLTFAKETNAIRIELKTEKTNSQALKLYQTMGFEIVRDSVYYRVPC